MPARRPPLAASVTLALTAVAAGLAGCSPSSGASGTAALGSGRVSTTTTTANAPAPLPTAWRPATTPRRVRRGVVALGDSVPSGYACGCAAYVQLVATALSRWERTGVRVANLAVPGATTATVLEQLRDPGTRAQLARSDVAIVNVGANDFDESQVSDPACAGASCYDDTLSGMAARLAAILRQVRALQPPGADIVVTGYWNVFLDGHVGVAQGPSYVHNSDALTRSVNAVVAKVGRQVGARYADVYAPFKQLGDDTVLLAPDGDHPNAAGHRVIAAAVLRALV